MSLRSIRIPLLAPLCAFALAAVIAVPAMALDPQAAPGRVRGTISAVDSTSITVKDRFGKTVKLALDDKTRYSTVSALTLADIKPGSYIGAPGMPTADGNIEATAVLVFPEDARGSGEGHRDWDLQPGSSMTNATVQAVVSSTKGRDLSVVYKGQTMRLIVPTTAPIVTIHPATMQDAKTGLAVVIFPTRVGTSESLYAARMIVEKDGVKPPM